MQSSFILFVASLVFVCLFTLYPSDQKGIDKTCVDNGGFVTKHEHYSTCSINKGVYPKAK